MPLPHYRRLRQELRRLHYLRQVVAVRPPLQLRRAALFLVAALVAALTTWLVGQGPAPREAAFMAGILTLAALLWVTEALPLFATALLVIALELLLLANPSGWPGLGFEEGPTPGYADFLAPIADPVIVLFFGGFILARAAAKEDVDGAVAALILRLFRGRPLLVMLGLMAVTALFSMFMSNTATTAMMITLVAPMLARVPEGDPLRKGLTLAVPFAANIGGMGTPIASPPNAVAVGFLRSRGVEVGFLDWMLIAVPLMVGLLLCAWLLLWAFYRPRTEGLRLVPEAKRMAGRGWFVVGVFTLTVGLWLSEPVHGLPTAVVAQLPIVAFTATGLLTRRDVNGLDWDILLLIAGGIALGVGVQRTGLDRLLVAGLPSGGTLALVMLVLATLALSTFMSNTAAANLLLPIGVAVAGSAASAAGIGLSIALAASASMALPISTPPNAIAYARGEFQTRDLALVGSIIGVLTAALILAFGGPIIGFWLGS